MFAIQSAVNFPV